LLPVTVPSHVVSPHCPTHHTHPSTTLNLPHPIPPPSRGRWKFPPPLRGRVSTTTTVLTSMIEVALRQARRGERWPMDQTAFAQVATSFATFRRRFAPYFGRPEAQRRAGQYLRGLLVQQTDRRNCENLADAVED